LIFLSLFPDDVLRNTSQWFPRRISVLVIDSLATMAEGAPTWNTSTSQFSAVNIGLTNGNDRHRDARRYFKEESMQVTEHLKGVHHARKLPDMQVQYSSTVDKMSKYQGEKPTYLQKKPEELKPGAVWHHGADSHMKYAQFQESMNSTVHRESDLNERKRRFNKEVGRKAAVDGIISGTAPAGKVHLFAKGASHTSILAQCGTLSMPDPRKEPPFVPKGRKWLGEAIGWSDSPNPVAKGSRPF